MKNKLIRDAAVVVLWLVALLFTGLAAAKDGMDDLSATEISGVVQSMPADGLIGQWKIAGKAVTTDATTHIDQEDGEVGVGAMVEAKGTVQADGSLKAASLEVKIGVGGPSPPPGGGDDSEDGEFTGPIVALPDVTLIGSWTVGSKTVIVVSTTALEQEHGAFVVGAIVEVDGLPDANGAIVASKIETKSGAPGGKVPTPGNVELTGKIDTLPSAGLIGNWQVGGRTVIVAAGTVLDAEHGPFVVGASVEAKGALDTTGALVATKIETTEGQGAPEPALEFFGKVVALPAGATGLIGVWQIDDKFVNVTAETKIEAKDVPLAVGGAVEVSGFAQPDGMIDAAKIETRVTVGAMAAQAPRAVEFVNAALGHFFMTANPTEIAILDAGNAWTRTGQSFNVGAGTSAVCRFYGMPPRGPDSHFFTADPTECQIAMTKLAAWTFEGHVFSTTLAVNGLCPAGMVAVHRFYNNPATVSAVNHRFTVTQQAFDQTQAMGWMHEGIVMCAQP
jgi:Domain of unknown function (DUF5666)